MSKITVKSTKSVILAAYEDLARELELIKRQLADITTEKGALLNQLESANQRVADLQLERDALVMSRFNESDIPDRLKESYASLLDERNELITENQRLVESVITAHERCDALEAIVAAQSVARPVVKSQPQSVRPSSDEVAGEVTQITDADKAVWAKFQRLSREDRMAIIEWARPTFGHVGIHNIQSVRAAWHEYCKAEDTRLDAQYAEVESLANMLAS